MSSELGTERNPDRQLWIGFLGFFSTPIVASLCVIGGHWLWENGNLPTAAAEVTAAGIQLLTVALLAFFAHRFYRGYRGQWRDTQ